MNGKRFSIITITLGLTLLATLASPTSAQTDSYWIWIGSPNSNWHSPSNWNTVDVPRIDNNCNFQAGSNSMVAQ